MIRPDVQGRVIAVAHIGGGVLAAPPMCALEGAPNPPTRAV